MSDNKAAVFPVGIGVGIAIGVALGLALDNLALGIGVGVAIGAGLGVVFSAKPKSKTGEGSDGGGPVIFDGGDTHHHGHDGGATAAETAEAGATDQPISRSSRSSRRKPGPSSFVRRCAGSKAVSPGPNLNAQSPGSRLSPG